MAEAALSGGAAGREVLVRAPDGVELSVREWGNPRGAEILFIHGAAQCYLSFKRQIASDLADRYRLVAFDLRGHGGSQKPLEERFYQRSEVWADDVQAVIEAKRLRRPILVGWSLGGRVVRQYLMHYGDRALGGINFLSTRPIEDPSIVGPGSRAIQASNGLDLPDRLRAEIDFLRNCYAKPPVGDDLLEAIAFNMIVPRAVREAIAGWSTGPEATREALGKVKVPVLITHGLLDQLILPKAAQMTSEATSGGVISWYEDCGHAPFYEDAARYNRELDRFVMEASARS
jgi:pimeloyl-ACP methyl ester carboxylesterase